MMGVVGMHMGSPAALVYAAGQWGQMKRHGQGSTTPDTRDPPPPPPPGQSRRPSARLWSALAVTDAVAGGSAAARHFLWSVPLGAAELTLLTRLLAAASCLDSSLAFAIDWLWLFPRPPVPRPPAVAPQADDSRTSGVAAGRRHLAGVWALR